MMWAGNIVATCSNKFFEKVPFQKIYYETALRAYYKNRLKYCLSKKMIGIIEKQIDLFYSNLI